MSLFRPVSFKRRLSLVSIAWAATCSLITAPQVRSAELHFKSGSSRTALLELFSSEGCSSCPPAERWLGELRTAPGLWADFVPVAFHVDYWNRQGWTDRFSTRDFTQRQYALSHLWGRDAVYTPCFVRNGEEWRPQNGKMSDGLGNAGVLSVTVAEASICRIDFSSESNASKLTAHVALLGGGFVSKVTSGENRGESLPQEFVALALVDYALSDEGASHRVEFSLPRPAITDGTRRAIAIWITRRDDLLPIQATGGWLK